MTTTQNPTAASPDLDVQSCGSGHGELPQAHILVNVADWFRDPHISPTMRAKTARDPEVAEHVRRTAGVEEFGRALFELVAVFVGLQQGTVRVALHCIGGRHRSPVMAEDLGALGRACGWNVEVSHRDLDKPVLTGSRTPGSGRSSAGL